MASKIGEQSINDSIGNVLRGMHPRWRKKGRIITENRRVISKEAGKKPDIVIHHPDGLSVVIESELHPDSREVEADARKRLRKKLGGGTKGRKNRPIEQVIALRIPKDLEDADQGMLDDEVRKRQYEFCIHFEPRGSNLERRWPKSGWIEGNLEDLAMFVEHASLSQDAIDEGMKVLEDGIRGAAEDLRDECEEKKTLGTLKKIAASLYQEECEQTTRMAMAIIINALSFHIAIAGSDGAENIKTLDELKGTGAIQKGKLLKEWKLIRQINYKPIFKIATRILKPIRNGTAHMILEQLAEVASNLDSLGATSQHDLSGRMLQRLIADREFLATYYTRPSSAALLAELAVSRLKTDWSNDSEIANLRIADFACGTGALLNAAYGAMMSRYRRGGGRRFKNSPARNRASSHWHGHNAGGNPPHNIDTFKCASNGKIWENADCYASLRRENWRD